jgi:hypothetical protein
MTAVCENYLSLDLAWLRRRKMLTPGRRSSVVWSVSGNRVGEIMIVPLADALLLVYRSLPAPGMAGSQADGAVHHDGDSLRRPPSLVCMPAMHEALPGAVRERSISVPSLLGHWLSFAARVPLEPNDEPDAQVASPARRLRQPLGAVPASTAVHAPSHVPNATGTLYVALATEHGGSAGICVSTQAADRRCDVSTGTRDCADRGRNQLCRPLLREQETRERGLIRHALWSVFDPHGD